jgi:hypothetical protein
MHLSELVRNLVDVTLEGVVDGEKTPRWVAGGKVPPRPWEKKSVTPFVTLGHPGLVSRMRSFGSDCGFRDSLGRR